MRATRKLFLASAIALAAMILTASTASAVTVRQEPGNTACSAVSVVAHVVTGGCHATFASNGTIPFYAHTGAAEVLISGCTWSFEARFNTAGVGFLTNQVFGGAGCTRAPCDETASMRKVPWSAQINGTAPGPFTIEFIFCLRTIASGEGGAGTNCSVHFGFTNVGHTYTAHPSGGAGTEAPCEGAPAVEISGSFTSTATERFELS